MSDETSKIEAHTACVLCGLALTPVQALVKEIRLISPESAAEIKAGVDLANKIVESLDDEGWDCTEVILAKALLRTLYSKDVSVALGLEAMTRVREVLKRGRGE